MACDWMRREAIQDVQTAAQWITVNQPNDHPLRRVVHNGYLHTEQQEYWARVSGVQAVLQHGACNLAPRRRGRA
eukprot:12908786-Prorocentrum_lima.AAC.1